MSQGIRYTDELNRDAVAQVVERGYAVSQVAERQSFLSKHNLDSSMRRRGNCHE
ncbi:hypothetical protein C8N36_1375 [Pelagimonas varians]|uniref:Transposase n=1 Tax=Pelagimonas varians TaxID=696760 RepID=A0A238L8D1_9RHOB|nr:hypothetical protein C8N36_1375 [Pelagimonas varians]SMX50566.1 hypothetical protein PEV8663_04709 [Pelagimonas varians]